MTQKIAPFLILGFVILIALTPFIVRVSIECRSQYGKCPDDINYQLSQYNGKNLYQARKKSSDYLQKNPLVSSFSLQFKVPRILSVNLLVKKPQFSIFDKETSKFALVDKDGKVISIVSNSSLPSVHALGGNLKVGDQVSDKELFALKLMQGVWEMYQVRSGEIQDNNLIIGLQGGVTVIFPQDGDTNVILGTLRLVYGKIESPDYLGKYSQIDLRFKNPVLR